MLTITRARLGAHEIEDGQVVERELLESAGGSPELLQAVEEALDQIAVFVLMGVVMPKLFAIGARRNAIQPKHLTAW